MVASILDSLPIQRVASAQPIGAAQGPGDLREKRTTPRDSVNKETPRVSTAEMEKAIAALDKLVAPSARALEFSLDDASGQVVVRVIDAETRMVLRQMPSEEVLAIARELDRLKGLLIRQMA
jgi:flagellar protein FlaG